MPSRPRQHRAAGWRPYKEPAKQVRKRQARRALPTNSAKWRKIREAQLAREPLCRCCTALSIVREATDVDHINGDDSDHRDCNLQSLCGSCHSRKTALENGGFGREPWNRFPFHDAESDPQRPERTGRGRVKV